MILNLNSWILTQVVFLLLYDKEEASTVKTDVVKQMVRDMGFEM